MGKGKYRFAELHYRVAGAGKRTELHYLRYFGKRDGNILDAGCSVGNFIAHSPGRITGIDSDSRGVAECRKRGFKAEEADLNRGIPCADGSFDNIHCWHVIEHLEDPLSFISELYRVLRKGGLLVLATPYFSSAYRRFYDDPTHISPMTRESLRRGALNAGFLQEKISVSSQRRPVGMGRLYARGLIPASAALLIEDILYAAGPGRMRSGAVLEALK